MNPSALATLAVVAAFPFSRLFGQEASAVASRPLPSLDAATLVWDCTASARLGWNGLLDRLAAVDVVFLGETHVDDTTHRTELEVLQRLLAARDGKVVLSLEMFERDAQPALDDYLQGRIDEATFVVRANAWSNYRTAYRPLIEAAKAAGIPVVAANFPSSLRRKLAAGGAAAMAALSADERALLPEQIHPASAAYWERVDRAVRGHMGGGGGTAEERLYDGQNLWDNAMGDNVAKAHTAHPDHIVLHVAGGFHVAWRDGTVAQFRLRAAGATAAVVSILPVSALYMAQPERDADQADYLVYAESVARGPFEGTYAVEVPAELRYRLHLPAGGDAGPVPLLVWLPDRFERAEDALALWMATLGADAAVAVVEQPFPQRLDDLGAGGSWQSGDGFRADYGRAQQGVERVVEYLTRRLPIDGRRVLVAGAGEGGAAVLWTALYGSWLDCDLVAFDPADLTRLSMEGLPDRAPTLRSLCMGSTDVDAQRLERVAVDFRKVGAAAAVAVVPRGAAARGDLLREHLGLPPVAVGSAGPVWVALERDLPRARQWAEIHAARLRAQGTDARVVAAADVPAGAPADRVQRMRIGEGGTWPVASFADGSGLPLAGGSFGGTTLVVLPAGASDEELAAWTEIESRRAIKRRSMFANLVIARVDGEPELPQVVADLRQRGRNRLLIVPAVFCADADLMRTIERTLGDAAAGMDVSWLPGLGAELVR